MSTAKVIARGEYVVASEEHVTASEERVIASERSESSDLHSVRT